MNSQDLEMQNSLQIFSEVFLKFKEERAAMVVVTLVNARGSAPQDMGARMLVGADSILMGTIGGGKIENHCLEVARVMLKENTKKAFHTWSLQKDIGMSCGGEVSFLFENESSVTSWNVVIFGAGHISQKLTRLLLTLDLNLTVIDNRQEWLEKLPASGKLTKIFNAHMEKEIEGLPDNSSVALMTMGHAKDVPILARALKEKTFPYLGVIGSQSKRNAMEKELKIMQIEASKLKNFICPIGEDIGSNDPAEIAVSITAQLLKYRDK